MSLESKNSRGFGLVFPKATTPAEVDLINRENQITGNLGLSVAIKIIREAWEMADGAIKNSAVPPDPLSAIDLNPLTDDQLTVLSAYQQPSRWLLRLSSSFQQCPLYSEIAQIADRIDDALMIRKASGGLMAIVDASLEEGLTQKEVDEALIIADTQEAVVMAGMMIERQTLFQILRDRGDREFINCYVDTRVKLGNPSEAEAFGLQQARRRFAQLYDAAADSFSQIN